MELPVEKVSAFSAVPDMQWDCSALITVHIRVSRQVQDDIIVIAAEEEECVTLYSPTVKQNLLCVLYNHSTPGHM